MVAKTPQSVYSAVCKLLDGMELNDEGEANAAIARALASKLDEAGQSDSGTIAMAISGIAKELRATVEAILSDARETDAWITDLFTEVGNSANA